MALLISLSFSLGCGTDASPVAPDPDVGAGASGANALTSGRRAAVPNNFPFKKILCFGDSLTVGVTLQSGGPHGQLTTGEGYVPKLWRLLEAEYGTGIELVTEGVGGENTREALDRIDTFIHRHDPDMVLILSGIVDVNVEVARFPVVRSNLAEMMRIVQLRGKVPIIGTYPKVNPGGFRVAVAENVDRLNDVIRQEAKAKNVLIADHDEASTRDYSGQGSDGVHPNDIGYERMAETWFEMFQAALEQLGYT